MRVLAPVEHPARRSRSRWVLDLVVVCASFAADVPFLLQGDTAPSAASFVLLALVVAPVVLRRVWPLAVFAFVVLSSLILTLADVEVRAGFTMLVATYTVASLCPRGTAIAAAVVANLGLFAITDTDTDGLWTTALLVTGLVIAATGLGLYSATRRAYLEQLHLRTAELELQRDQQAQLAVAAERSRIAREMHDIVAHHLTVMVALSDGALASVHTAPSRAAEAMDVISRTGREALADARRVLGVLRDSRPQGSGDTPHGDDRAPAPDLDRLPALLEQVRAAGLPTTLHVQGGTQDAAPGTQTAVYRLVQEALTNTLKHAGPGARAEVRMRWSAGSLSVEVSDTGRGAAVDHTAGRGGGIVGMHERVRAFGGDIEVGPRRPVGWLVSARLPLHADSPMSSSAREDRSVSGVGPPPLPDLASEPAPVEPPSTAPGGRHEGRGRW